MSPIRNALATAMLLATTACASTPSSDTRVPMASPGERRFTGTVESIDTGCYADGVCSMVIDGRKVVWMRGWSHATWGQVRQPPDVGEYAGRKVEVWCKSEVDGCTLEGNAAYFIRPAG